MATRYPLPMRNPFALFSASVTTPALSASAASVSRASVRMMSVRVRVRVRVQMQPGGVLDGLRQSRFWSGLAGHGLDGFRHGCTASEARMRSCAGAGAGTGTAGNAQLNLTGNVRSLTTAPICRLHLGLPRLRRASPYSFVPRRWVHHPTAASGQNTGNEKEKEKPATKAVVHENIYTIPNILTTSRLVAAPVIGYSILTGSHTLALSLFAYAAVTDLVDGYIARRWNQQTVVGTVIDPMADKFLMTIGVVCLAMKAAIPMWLAGLILARDVGLGFAAIYYRWISLPPPKTMKRYWDFSLPSAEVKPTEVSKVNTALQLALLGSAMAMPVLPEAMMTAWYLQEGMVGLQYLVAFTTSWSGLQYIFNKDVVRILHDNKNTNKDSDSKTN
ncbi:CDP-diacylglycerol-glycerol-3-phosphate 3-phosphatidyltransferase [Trichophyton soudanense CBS 452.61]|uniref:CDP-diacylglycerol-glycerol-3-phosphate 3-phosphatidyltransferase n=1 Tax=Trichophyton soudanense CBS 452.61 TaxID=1215331 RepID=A0A022Y1T0_TRISD|nr:CDP-diacylglycerol-glycerol-3-phosphate 3-phosphatidyltransferase [Trichophyton soudanense CBS 452.61]